MKSKNIHRLFDYLGFPAFLLLFIDAILDVIQGQNSWRVWTRLIIAFCGMIIDGYLVLIYKEK